MSKIKDKIKKVRVNKRLTKTIGKLGNIEISDDDGITCRFDKHCLKQITQSFEMYDLNLLRVKELREITESDNITPITYVFSDITFHKKLKIKSCDRNSNIMFSNCVFEEGIEIDGTNSVIFSSAIVCHSEDNKFFNIRANDVKFVNASFMTFNLDREINIIAENLEIYNTCLVTSINLNFNTNNLKIIDSTLRGQRVSMNFDRIEEKESKIFSMEKLSIISKNQIDLSNIDSPKIFYNSENLSRGDNIQLSKSKKQLIEDLKELKSNYNSQVNTVQKVYQKNFKKN